MCGFNEASLVISGFFCFFLCVCLYFLFVVVGVVVSISVQSIACCQSDLLRIECDRGGFSGRVGKAAVTVI